LRVARGAGVAVGKRDARSTKGPRSTRATAGSVGGSSDTFGQTGTGGGAGATFAMGGRGNAGGDSAGAHAIASDTMAVTRGAARQRLALGIGGRRYQQSRRTANAGRSPRGASTAESGCERRSYVLAHLQAVRPARGAAATPSPRPPSPFAPWEAPLPTRKARPPTSTESRKPWAHRSVRCFLFRTTALLRRTPSTCSHPSWRASETGRDGPAPSGASLETTSRSHETSSSRPPTACESSETTSSRYNTTSRSHKTTSRSHDTTARSHDTTARSHGTTWRSHLRH
jgi:hypothetical protein